MNQEYVVNEHVRYAGNGVCRIDGITTMAATGPARYYVLKPVAESGSTIYVPMANETLLAQMEPVLNEEQIRALILESKRNKLAWVEDRKERGEVFHKILQDCKQEELLSMISCLYLKKQELIGIGKNLISADDGVLKRAEKLIEGEFAFILGIPPQQVSAYIQTVLGLPVE